MQSNFSADQASALSKIVKGNAGKIDPQLALPSDCAMATFLLSAHSYSAQYKPLLPYFFAIQSWAG